MEDSDRNSSALNELVFLRQTVHRLNAVLSKYQGADALNPNTDQLLTGLDEGLSAPWLTDPSLLSPLIQEYETHLANLVAQLSQITEQNNESADKLKVITEENERLHAELNEVVQQQLQAADGLVINFDFWLNDDLLLKNLQSQLELVTAEKDAAIEMNKETIKHLDRVRQERAKEEAHAKAREKIFHETKEMNEKLTDANLQMQLTIGGYLKENQEYIVATTQQASELKSCHEQLRQSKQLVRDATLKGEKSKIEIDSLKSRIKHLDDEKTKFEHKCKNQFIENQQLETVLAEVESKFAQALQSNTELQSQVDSLKIHVRALEKTNSEVDAKEMNYLMQIRESAQRLDDAVLERDAAIVREKQKEEALQNSSAAMEILVHEVGERVAREVEKVKGHSNAQIQRLMNEIETMELEITNLRSEVARAKRAKRDVEEEMDSLSRQRQETREDGRIEEYQRRTLIAERAKDDAMITVQKLQDEIKRAKIETEDDRLRLLSLNQGLDQRVRRLQREMEESQHERLHLTETVNQQKQDVQRLKEEARLARLNAVKEFSVSRDSLQREKKQLEIKLKNSDVTSREGMRQLHKMLADQQRITARWKEESNSACERYEEKVHDLKSQLSQNRRRCDDLTNKLKQGPKPTSIPIEKIHHLEESNRQLRAKLHETEYKLLSATQAISEQQGHRNRMTMRDLS
uniref:Sodium channel and clathrin linker 1 n=1 Tax=Ciona intestinalis TaxID=7719 RepID=H2XSP6_CIOIN